METFEIDEFFLRSKERGEVVDAFKEIKEVQSNTVPPLKLGIDFLDDYLPEGANNKMIFIGSRPGQGKTHNCETVIRNLLNREINPDHQVRLLRMNLEMTTKSLILRELKNELGLSIKEILRTPFETMGEEQYAKVKRVYKRFNDKRVVNVSKALNKGELDYMLRKFIETCGVEEKKVVLVDHLHIYSDKASIDEVLRICNEVKMDHKNITFIFYFQFNRVVEDLWRETKTNKVNPRNMFPHSGHIYQTDLLMQYADIVMGMVIPQAVDLDEFAVVHKKRYAHLSNDFIPGAEKDLNYAKLKGRNRIYYNFIKIRGIDSFDDPRIFSGVLDPARETDYIPVEDDTPTFDSLVEGEDLEDPF